MRNKGAPPPTHTHTPHTLDKKTGKRPSADTKTAATSSKWQVNSTGLVKKKIKNTAPDIFQGGKLMQRLRAFQ